MALTGQQRKRLHEALINGFPNMASLEQMLSYELEKDLRKIAGEGNLENIVFQLIKIADCDGWIDRLICGACTSNPENERLRAIKEELLPILNQETFSASRTDNSPQRTNQYPVSESNEEEPRIFQQSSRFRNRDQALEAEEYEKSFRQLLQDGHPTGDTLHEELRRSSRLSKEKIERIEHRVDEEYKSEKREYEQALSRVIWLFIILDKLFVSPRLRSVPPCSKLSDNDLRRIYSRLKREAWRRNKNNVILSATVLPLIVLIAFSGYHAYRWISTPQQPDSHSETRASLESNKAVDVSKKISSGEKSLFSPDFFKENMSKDRKLIIDKFKEAQTTEKYEEVEILFNDYFRNKDNRNDAEARIFKNNAMALARGNPLIIGVSVPIGTSPNVAMEILRGVAQAQNEFNNEFNKSKQGRLLQVIIGDDENNEKTVEGIAREFMNKGVLAVIGSNNTKTSLEAAKIYDQYQNQIVMISPTAFGDGFDNRNALQMVSETAVDGLVKKLGESLSSSSSVKRKILICSDENSDDSKNFIKKFKSGIKKFPQVEISNDYSCRLDAGLDDIRNVLRSASGNGNINAILLAPHIDEEPFKKVIEVARELQSFNLFGSPTMNAAYILKEGTEDVYKAFNGMKVAVPWNPEGEKGKKFLNSANCLWGGDVNWRTAMAFDATTAIINRLKENPQKVDIRQIESQDSDFPGVTGNVSFAGNRKIEASIVQFEYEDNRNEDKNVGFQPTGTCSPKNAK